MSRTSCAVGIDVAAQRGCDVVALDDGLVARPLGRVSAADELRALLTPIDPAVVAIDAPPAWARGNGTRQCERELRAVGISIFATPDAERGAASRFYDWMRTGFEMFAGAVAYPTLETFPHATAVALRGRHPDAGLLRRPREKRAWRTAALEAAGVDHRALHGIDEIDAALCAVTGLRWLDGATEAWGDPADGVITVPLGLPGSFRRRGTP